MSAALTILVFDSGLGGLTVLARVREQMAGRAGKAAPKIVIEA